jgi:hypothetical protein
MHTILGLYLLAGGCACLWLHFRWRRSIDAGNLTVQSVADLIGIGESDVRDIMDGRANLSGGKWRQLQVAARRAA